MSPVGFGPPQGARQGRQQAPTVQQIIGQMAESFCKDFPALRDIGAKLADIFLSASVPAGQNQRHFNRGLRTLANETFVAARDVADNLKKMQGIEGYLATDTTPVDGLLTRINANCAAIGQSLITSFNALRNRLSTQNLLSGQADQTRINTATQAFSDFATALETRIDQAYNAKVIKRAEINAGQAPAIVQALKNLNAPGEVDLQALGIRHEIRSSKGTNLSIAISRDQEGRVSLVFRSPQGASQPLEIKMLLDKTSLEQNPSDPSRDNVLEELTGRLDSKIHEVLKEFYKTSQDQNTINAMCKDSAWGIITSPVGQMARALGCNITAISNGEISHKQVTGLVLSGAKLHNFSLRENVGIVDLRGTVFSGTYRFDNNQFYSSRIDNMVLEDGPRGRRNSFRNNDFHGDGASATNLNVNNCYANGNNFLGVPLQGLKAASFTQHAASVLGLLSILNPGVTFSAISALNARIAVRSQFSGTRFDYNLINGDALQILKDSRIASTASSRIQIYKLTMAGRELSSLDLRAILNNSALLAATPNNSPVPNMPNATQHDVTSVDGRTKFSLTVGPDRSSCFNEDDSVLGRAGTMRGNSAVLRRTVDKTLGNVNDIPAYQFGVARPGVVI